MKTDLHRQNFHDRYKAALSINKGYTWMVRPHVTNRTNSPCFLTIQFGAVAKCRKHVNMYVLKLISFCFDK